MRHDQDMTGEPIPLHYNEDLAAAFVSRGKDGPALDVDAPVRWHLLPPYALDVAAVRATPRGTVGPRCLPRRWH